jgi:uncharacterized membrane protein
LSGYDFAVNDQAIWKYSNFKIPISTIIAYYDTPYYFDHFEPIYALISPVFWFWDDNRILFPVQAAAVVSAGYLIYLLAIRKKIIYPVAVSLLITFLSFYGIQNAIWADFHSTVLAIPFLAGFIYFLEIKNYKLATLFFILAIVSKEDMALFTLLISAILFFYSRNKKLLYFVGGSILYLLFVFYFFYPVFAQGYRFQNSEGMLSNLNLVNFVNTSEKREAIFYSIASYGFLPLGAPLYLLLFLSDLGHYFVLGSDYVSSPQGLFLHYRSTLALFLAWPAIISISKFRRLNKPWVAVYLIFCALIIQYILHLPLSYLTKDWFWKKPEAIFDIQKAMKKIPKESSIATQVNIAPHMSHRDKIYILWPSVRDFKVNSPCGNASCRWFSTGKVEYILVDTSNAWDARHFLESREDFQDGISNLEKFKVIEKVFDSGNTSLFKVIGKI